LIRRGRVYDHDGDIHQPAQADILIAGELIERLGQNLPADARRNNGKRPEAR